MGSTDGAAGLEKLDSNRLALVTRHLDAKSIAALTAASKKVKANTSPATEARMVVSACQTLQGKCEKVHAALVKAARGRDPARYGDLKTCIEAKSKLDEIKSRLDAMKKMVAGQKDARSKPAIAAIGSLDALIENKSKKIFKA